MRVEWKDYPREQRKKLKLSMSEASLFTRRREVSCLNNLLRCTCSVSVPTRATVCARALRRICAFAGTVEQLRTAFPRFSFCVLRIRPSDPISALLLTILWIDWREHSASLFERASNSARQIRSFLKDWRSFTHRYLYFTSIQRTDFGEARPLQSLAMWKLFMEWPYH